MILGLALFLGVHSVSIVAPAWRDGRVQRLGEKPWKGLYALVSVVGFAMLVVVYGIARESPVLLYAPPAWTRHLTLLLMLPVFVLLFAAYLPGRIKSAVKHPMLAAVMLWALAHLLANGTLADVLLFGGFLVWSVADRISLKYRVPRPVPGASLRPVNDLIAGTGGLVVYVLFVAGLHRWLIGVSPF